MTAYVSNGNGTPQVLEYIRPWIDLYKVDLKSFDDKHYRQLGGRLEPILADHPRAARDGNLAGDRHAADPGLQRRSARSSSASTAFLAGVSPDIPWHVTAFHKDYRMSDPENTTPEMLMTAAEIGRRATACVTSTPATSRDASATSNTRAATTAARSSSSATATSSRATG